MASCAGVDLGSELLFALGQISLSFLASVHFLVHTGDSAVYFTSSYVGVKLK